VKLFCLLIAIQSSFGRKSATEYPPPAMLQKTITLLEMDSKKSFLSLLFIARKKLLLIH